MRCQQKRLASKCSSPPRRWSEQHRLDRASRSRSTSPDPMWTLQIRSTPGRGKCHGQSTVLQPLDTVLQPPVPGYFPKREAHKTHKIKSDQVPCRLRFCIQVLVIHSVLTPFNDRSSKLVLPQGILQFRESVGIVGRPWALYGTSGSDKVCRFQNHLQKKGVQSRQVKICEIISSSPFTGHLSAYLDSSDIMSFHFTILTS